VTPPNPPGVHRKKNVTNFKAGRRIVLFTNNSTRDRQALATHPGFATRKTTPARAAARRPIKVIDYGYLLPQRPLIRRLRLARRILIGRGAR